MERSTTQMAAPHLRDLYERELNAERLLDEAIARETLKELERLNRTTGEDRPPAASWIAWSNARATLTSPVGRATARLKEARVERQLAEARLAGHRPEAPDALGGRR